MERRSPVRCNVVPRKTPENQSRMKKYSRRAKLAATETLHGQG
jgi:hypothetical protein